MEGTRIPAAAFTGGGFRHGPLEVVDRDHRCVVLAPGGATHQLSVTMATEIAEMGSHVVAITDQDLTLPGPHSRVLAVPECGEDLFCVSAATTQGLLMNEVAQRLGLRPGELRYGQKVTRRE
jgi:glucosamine--fructose-6-phosphate aminotransferase (isomerizing)